MKLVIEVALNPGEAMGFAFMRIQQLIDGFLEEGTPAAPPEYYLTMDDVKERGYIILGEMSDTKVSSGILELGSVATNDELRAKNMRSIGRVVCMEAPYDQELLCLNETRSKFKVAEA